MPRSRSTAIQSERTRRRSPRALTSPRQLDRPAKQQQFLGQCRLAGVGVRNDREGPPADNLVGQRAHRSALICCRGYAAVAGTPTAAPALNGYMLSAGVFANASLMATSSMLGQERYLNRLVV